MILIVAIKMLDSAPPTSVQLIVVPFKSLFTAKVVNVDIIGLDPLEESLVTLKE